MMSTVITETKVSPLSLTPELQRELDEQNARLESALPEEVISWAAERFGSQLTWPQRLDQRGA